MIASKRIGVWVAAALLSVSAGVVQAQIVVNPDGTHSVVHGNIVVNPNGTHSVIHGNIVVNPNGTHSVIHGNVVVNPNGTHSVIHGNVAIAPDGTHSIIVGNASSNFSRKRSGGNARKKAVTVEGWFGDLVERQNRRLRRMERQAWFEERAAEPSERENITLTVTGIRSDKGRIAIQAFTDEGGFKDSKPVARFRFPKTGMADGTLKVTLALKPGVYGLAILDDENSNDIMDNNLLKMPKEGFGFSDYYHSGMGRPKFDDFKITVSGQAQAVTAKLRYL